MITYLYEVPEEIMIDIDNITNINKHFNIVVYNYM